MGNRNSILLLSTHLACGYWTICSFNISPVSFPFPWKRNWEIGSRLPRAVCCVWEKIKRVDNIYLELPVSRWQIRYQQSRDKYSHVLTPITSKHDWEKRKDGRIGGKTIRRVWKRPVWSSWGHEGCLKHICSSFSSLYCFIFPSRNHSQHGGGN